MTDESPHRDVEDIVADYVDRMNRGMWVTRAQVRAEHPALAEEILGYLETFVDFAEDGDDARPLGTLGGYTLRRQIGRGGMGIVYEAWESSMDRVVALKVLPGAVAADAKARERFRREARVAGQLRHPSVVSVYGMRVEDETPYYAMEYVDGETLADILRRQREEEGRETLLGSRSEGLIYFARLAAAFAGVAEGLHYAHSRGIIHRDVKPSNLILDRAGSSHGAARAEGCLRLLDFGLAHLEGQETLTRSGDVVGTPFYMSPEQVRAHGDSIDHRTDVYSLGATLYEALTLAPPFRGQNDADTLSQILRRDAVAPGRLNSRIPIDLEVIVLKCLRKNPRDRYATALALAEDLRRFVRGDPVEARPEAVWEKLARRAWHARVRIAVTSLAALLLLVLTLLGVAWYRLDLEEREAGYDRLITKALSEQLGTSGNRLTRASGFDGEGGVLLYLLGHEARSRTTLETRTRSARDLLEEAVALFPENPAAYYHLARCLWSQGDDETALEVLNEVVGFAPDSAPVRGLRAALFEARGELKRAETELAEARARGDGHLAELWFHAHGAVMTQDWEQALTAYKELIRREASYPSSLEGTSLELRLGRGLAYVALEEFDLAGRDFNGASVLSGRPLAAELLVGDTLIRDGKPGAAATVFEEFLETTSLPDHEVLTFLLGSRYLHYETIISFLEQMEPSADHNRALVFYLILDLRTETASREVDRALAERPDDALLFALKGWAMACRDGAASDAGELLARAGEMGDDDPSVFYFLARGYAELSEWDQVETALRRALDLDDRFVPARSGLARLLNFQGSRTNDREKLTEAIHHEERCLAEGPDRATYLLVRSDSYRGLGDAERADADLARVLEIEPRNWHALFQQGLVQNSRMNLVEAAEKFERAMAISQSADVKIRLPKILRRMGHFDEALQAACEAVADHDDLKPAWFYRDLSSLLAEAPEVPENLNRVDEVIRALETYVEQVGRPHFVLRTLAHALLYAPERRARSSARALALAREACDAVRADPATSPHALADYLTTVAAAQKACGSAAAAIATLEEAARVSGEYLEALETARRSHLPSLATFASVDWALEATEREPVVADGADGAVWSYVPGREAPAPDTEWTRVEFLDTHWKRGRLDDIVDTLQAELRAASKSDRELTTLYCRHAFTAPMAQRYRDVTLTVRVNGGYVAYLNGTELGRYGVDPKAPWHAFDESALQEGNRGYPPVAVPVEEPLRPGEKNVLALQMLRPPGTGHRVFLTTTLTATVERSAENDKELLEAARAISADGNQSPREVLRYLEARILERDGLHEAAGHIYAELVGTAGSAFEPHASYARNLVRRGRAQLAETHLRRVLMGGLVDESLSWQLWTVLQFADLGRSPAEILENFPRAKSKHGADVRWLLEQLDTAGCVRINCGPGAEHESPDGTIWGGDRFYTSGDGGAADGKTEINGTDDDELYRQFRWFLPRGLDLPGYRVPLPPGRYRVTLHFADPPDYPVPRVFDVMLEGDTCRRGYDLDEAGDATATQLTFSDVPVEDGLLDISFVHRVTDPVLSAIEVLRLPTR